MLRIQLLGARGEMRGQAYSVQGVKCFWMGLRSFCLRTLSPIEIPQQLLESLPLPWATTGWAHAEQTFPAPQVFVSYLHRSTQYNIKWSNNSNCVVLFASPEHLLSVSGTAWKSIILVYSLSCSNNIRNTSHQYAPSWEQPNRRCVSWLWLYSQAHTHLVSAHHNCKSV